MKVINYTDLRMNLKRWLDSVMHDSEELGIKRENNQDVVLISMEEYRSLTETKYLLPGKNREHLLESILEAEKGETVQKGLIEE